MSDQSSNKQPLCIVEVLNGGLKGTAFPLKDGVVIGRKDESSGLDPALDVLLTDNRVSRSHARVSSKKGRFYLEDLHSTNGTFLNAIKLRPETPVILSDGCNIQVGGIHMRFCTNAYHQKHVSAKKVSSPWQSEIGLNEEAFDFSSGSGAENRKRYE